MSITDRPAPPKDRPALGGFEFIALMAMLVATVAFSIDAMLPALPQIGAELSPGAPNRAQLIIGVFLLGLGAGTFFVGPLSDRFGRKPVILVGSALYVGAAFLAVLAPSLELLIASRAVQGLGAAAARVVAMAIIRDLHAGRAMARMMSFVMLVFTLVPAVAPLAGSMIISVAGWRGIFAAFVAFALVSNLWMLLRLPEPLPRDRRIRFKPQQLWQACAEVLAHGVVRRSIAIQTLCLATMFAAISSIQPIMDETFGRGAEFPYWFALIAAMAALGSLLNASLVMRLGMRRLIVIALTAETVLTGLAVGAFLGGVSGDAAFAVYLVWKISVFAQISLTMGNLNALALEPLGHIAGTATSIVTSLATVGSAILAMPVGLAYDGTPLPLLLGSLMFLVLGLFLMRGMGRGGG